MKLDAVEDENAVRLVAVTVHPDISGGHAPDLHHIHARADFHAGCGLGEPERLDHLALALGRRAVVGAHAGDEERIRPIRSQPVAGRLRDPDDIVDPPAAGRDRNPPAGRAHPEAVELTEDFRLDVLERLGDEFLIDAEDVHAGLQSASQIL